MLLALQTHRGRRAIHPSRSAHALALVAAVLAWPGRVMRHRRLMRQMAGMNDHELRDIGLTRQDVLDATAVRASDDPSRLLARRAVDRRRHA